MNKRKDDITCNCTDHATKWILTNSFWNYGYLIFKQSSTNISIDNQKHISEVKSLLEYFYKIKHTSINRKLVSKIFSNFEFSFVFYYYQDSLFDVSIELKLHYLTYNIIREEEFINLKAPLNSSILSKTLEEGSQIKELIFFSKYLYSINRPGIDISFSSNTLTIDWYFMKPNYLNILLELGPGLILRLKDLIYHDIYFWNLDLIQRFLSYCGRSPPCWKLFFSKIVIEINNENIRRIEFFEDLNKLKHLIDSLSKVYDVELENITYEDLFRDRGISFNEFIERQRNKYNSKKLKFERALKYSRIECYLDDFFNNKKDGFNQTIAELKLKEFEFYEDKINMKRYDYNLVLIYCRIIAV